MRRLSVSTQTKPPAKGREYFLGRVRTFEAQHTFEFEGFARVYKIRFQPLSKISGTSTGEVFIESATEALKVVEDLMMSDEQVEIWSSKEGNIDIRFLRILAREEKSI